MTSVTASIFTLLKRKHHVTIAKLFDVAVVLVLVPQVTCSERASSMQVLDTLIASASTSNLILLLKLHFSSFTVGTGVRSSKTTGLHARSATVLREHAQSPS